MLKSIRQNSTLIHDLKNPQQTRNRKKLLYPDKEHIQNTAKMILNGERGSVYFSLILRTKQGICSYHFHLILY